MEKLNENSEEVVEFINMAPHWVVRLGLLILALFILTLIFISYFVRYPDIIEGRVSIASEPKAIDIFNNVNGKITLYVKDGDKVEQGDVLACMDEIGKSESIASMSDNISSMRDIIFSDSLEIYASKLALGEPSGLGDLRVFYLDYKESVANLQKYIADSASKRRISQFEREANRQLLLLQHLHRQKKIYQEEVKIQYQINEIDSILVTQKVIPKLQALSNSQANYRILRDYENINIAIANSELSLEKIESGKLNEFLSDEKTKFQVIQNVRSAYTVLESQISLWSQKYLLKSPADGHVHFYGRITDNVYFTHNQKLMIVVPEVMDVIGEVFLPISGYGKVYSGQKVLIQLDNYPSEEFGNLIGKIVYVADVPNENFYLIRVKLMSLKTDFGKNIAFREKMQGRARVVTNDLRLMERIFYSIRKISEIR